MIYIRKAIKEWVVDQPVSYGFGWCFQVGGVGCVEMDELGRGYNCYKYCVYRCDVS